MYIWLIAPSFLFRWLKAWGYVIFHWCFDYDGWWLTLHIFFLSHELIGGWIFLLLESFWGYVHGCSHLSFYLSFRNLPNGLSLSTLFTLPMTLFTLRRLVIFYHSNGIIFIGIVCYDSYYVNNRPLKDFQVHIFLCDWVLGVVTIQLPLDFHPLFSYPKPHGLKWDKGASILWYLKNPCLNFQLNPMWQSKVIAH